MTFTENNITKVYNERNKHVATITPHLNGWLLQAFDLPRVLYFSDLSEAIYNAH